MRKIQLKLEPLSCPSCIKNIEAVLSKLEGVHGVRVLFSSSKVKALYEDALITPEEIKVTVENLGYEVISY